MTAGDRIFLWCVGAAILTVGALWLFEEPLLVALVQAVPPWIGMPGVLLVSLGIIWRMVKIRDVARVVDETAYSESTAGTQPRGAGWVPAGAHAVFVTVIPILDGAVIKPMLKRFPNADARLAAWLSYGIFLIFYVAILVFVMKKTKRTA